MRRLTAQSARLVHDAWVRTVTEQDAEYDDVAEAIEALGELDARRDVLVRKEQSFLRRHLFGADGSGICTLCGREFPVPLLVAAHVKRRAECSDEERRDFLNNVFAMCVFGCDALFERGILVVVEGVVRRGKTGTTTEALRGYIDQVVGTRSKAWHSRSARYFEAHAKRARQG